MPVEYKGDEECGCLKSTPESAPTESFTPPLRRPLNTARSSSAWKQPSRVTVVERLYHQPSGQPPVSFESPFYRFLGADDAAYIRVLDVGPVWQALDLAWVAPAGMLFLENKGDRDAHDLVVGVTEHDHAIPFARIPPGESMRLTPTALAQYQVACPDGESRLQVVAIPS